jgi:hypothetical protein
LALTDVNDVLSCQHRWITELRRYLELDVVLAILVWSYNDLSCRSCSWQRNIFKIFSFCSPTCCARRMCGNAVSKISASTESRQLISWRTGGIFTQNLPGSKYRFILCLNLAKLLRNAFLHGLFYFLLLMLNIDGSGFTNLSARNIRNVWSLACLSCSFILT